MNCPKEIFTDIYRLNMLLVPMCKSMEAKKAFSEYEKVLCEVKQQIEHDLKMDKCKAEP